MSTILGLFGDLSLPEARVQAMLGHPTGPERRCAVWRGDGALLAIERPVWQMDSGIGFGELIAEVAGVIVVADASLYYRSDLRRQLRQKGIVSGGEGPGHLIAAAYRAWGEACVDRLEGDWAFILWDVAERSVLAARDFGGRRPLHYATLGETLVVSSGIANVLAHPDCLDELNISAIADTAAGFLGSSSTTCYRAISRLQAGYSLRWHHGELQAERHWNPAPREDPRGLPFEEAATHLRELLTQAVRERLSGTGPTTVQLSGGWDSTAIYGVGMALLTEDEGAHGPLLPVSISYPIGDPGREDEIIELILRRWDGSTRWLNSEQIPLFDSPERAAAVREEPFAHVYEHWNRRLVQAGRELESRVMFDGFGGDSLFQCSPAYFSDLLRRGRLLQLRREWRAKGMRGVSPAMQWCIQPLLPERVARMLARPLSRRGIEVSRERKLPSWIDPTFEKQHAMMERERRNTPRYGRDTASSDEIHWHLTNPWISRMLAENYSIGLAVGLELRSPLFDRRIIEFAMHRPWHERSYRKQTKRLLRRSVQGLLPDEVLAPRRYRTGMTTGFFERHMRTELPELRASVLGDPLLGELGILDPKVLQRTIDDYLRQPDPGTGVQIFFTLVTELWVRAHARVPLGRERSKLPLAS